MRDIVNKVFVIAILLLLRQAPVSAQSLLANYGTLDDEKAAYQKWGWSYTAGQVPSIPTGPHSITSLDVHSNLEADDLWQNILMWKRTGNQGYYDLATSWASYYKTIYRNDYKSDLSGYFGDHTFGWGLVEWAKVTGDNSYLTAANGIGDDLQTAWYNTFGQSIKAGFYGLRGPGRHLKLAVALGRRQWADDIWAQLRDSFRWEERTVNSTAVGFWKEDSSAFPWATGATGAISSFEFAVLNEGLSDYYDLTGDPEVKRRLILMARFAQQFGLEPTVNHTGHWIIVDYPAKDSFFHSGLGAGLPLDPFYTCTLVNVLVRGYLLSGDSVLLDRAKYTWDRSSKATPEDAYPYTNRTPANQVGHFMNSQVLSGGIYYVSDGELPYVGLLFKAAGSSTVASTENWKLLPNSSLRTMIASSSYIVSPGPDGWSYPTENIVADWNGGIIDTKRRMLIIPASGGHNSWFYNDVWGYDSVNLKWINLRKAFVPYMTIAEADLTHKLVYDDGSPSTVHTYDGISYLDQLDEVFMIGGPGWNTTGQGPPPRRFSMTNAGWSYGTSQGIYPENGTSSAVNPADGTVWFRTSTRLYSYNVQADKYTVLSDNLPNPQTYYTALVINGVFYMFGGGGVIKVAPGQQTVQLSLSGEPLPAVPAPGVAWEAALQRVIFWGGGADVYFVDPASLTVSKRQVSGTAPGASQGLGTYKRFGRVGQGQYLLMNSIDGVYALTIDTGSAPPPPPPPPPPPTAPPPPPPTSPPPTSPPPTSPPPSTSSVPVTLEAENMPTKTTGGPVDQGWIIWNYGYIETSVNFPSNGKYRFVITARGQAAAGAAPVMELWVDQQPVNKVSVPATSWTPYTIDANLTAGSRKIAIAFTNDYYELGEDRNLYVDKVAISVVAGTTNPPPPTTNPPPPTTNPPPPTTDPTPPQERTLIVGPKLGEVLQGRLTPIVASTTLTNVAKLEIRIDGKLVATATSNSIRYAWTPMDTGTHTIEVSGLSSTTVLAYWGQTVVVK